MKILVVDDEVKLGRVVKEMLELAGHEVEHLTRGKEAMTRLRGSPIDLLVTDLRMPEVDGLALLQAARSLTPPPEVIMMTAYGTAESAVAAMKAGAIDYLTKPFSMDELRLRVARIDAERSATRKNERLVESLAPGLVAESAVMKQVLAAARQVASTTASVLLLGESGTGKSQLARFIHYSSPRGSAPLVEVHCAALPETLLESELFGHERGAFTGADQQKEGLLASADKGSLFLDEIGEVSPATQVKLLRFLQDHEFVPVGSARPRTVDVRVLAATNRDLEAAVAERSFREDLYYRLNVFPIRIPPLRARAEDILPLADRFLGGRGQPRGKLSDRARSRLLGYEWPGNVRELENTLERALILAGDEVVGPEHLWLGQEKTVPQRARDPRSFESIADELLGEPSGGREAFNLDSFERDLLFRAIARTNGNKTAAARLLGITRRRLYSRLKSLADRTAEGEESVPEEGA